MPILIITSVAALSLNPLIDTASDAQASWQWDFKHKQIGATWTAEYMPLWVRADRTAIPNPSRAPVSESSLATPALSVANISYTLRRYHLSGPLAMDGQCQPGTLRLHQFYLPQWHATLSGQPLPTFPSTDFGLLTVDLPCLTPGRDILELDFGMTSVEQVSLLISLASLVMLLWLWRGTWMIVPIVVTMLLGWQLSNFQPATSNIQNIAAQLEDVAELVAVRFDHQVYRAGDSLHVTLTWRARRETRENFKAFVHLMDASGTRVIAQSDGDPVGGFTPSSQWHVGEVIEDTRVLRIPEDTAPGTLQLFAGLYRYPSLKNLKATHDGISFPTDRIPFGTVEITK